MAMEKPKILQPWNNNGSLAMLVYKWNGTGLSSVWSTSDIGAGYGNLGFLTADVDGDGKTEILQPWNNNGRLAMLVYKWNGTGLSSVWSTSDIGAGSPGVFLTADVDGDGKVELLQPWNNNSLLAMILYKWNGTGLNYLWGTSDMGN